MYFYDELSVDGEMSYEECNRWFISLVTRMIHVKCFRKWVNAFKYDDIKAVKKTSCFI